MESVNYYNVIRILTEKLKETEEFFETEVTENENDVAEDLYNLLINIKHAYDIEVQTECTLFRDVEDEDDFAADLIDYDKVEENEGKL